MKPLQLFITLLLFTALSISAQSQKYIFGAATTYEIPIGALNDRFTSTFGGTLFAGGSSSEDWSWIGSLSFAEFSKPNYDRLNKQVEVQTGSNKKIFLFPLSSISINFKTVSLLAEANYTFYRNSFISTNLIVGFGFTNWTFSRQRFTDSLFANISGTGTLTKISTLDVPSNSQIDWSGTLKLGFSASIVIAKPIEIYTNIGYKLIIGELWPALSLDMENVSGLQILQFSVGLKTKF